MDSGVGRKLQSHIDNNRIHAPNTKNIIYSPVYPDTVEYPPDSGYITKGTGSSGNVYNVSTSSGTVKGGILYLAFTLPINFKRWAPTAITVEIMTTDTTSSNGCVHLGVKKNGTDIFLVEDLTSASSTEFEEQIITSTDLATLLTTWAAGDILKLAINPVMKTGYAVNIGRTKFYYV